MSDENTVVVRWYTRARRIPQLIGSTRDGTRLPGGPYTITAFLGAVGVLLIGKSTMSLWGHWGFFGNFVVLFGACVAVGFGLNKLPVGGRNPVLLAIGIVRAMRAPRAGRYQGEALSIRRPHRVRGGVILTSSHRAVPGPAPSAAAPSGAAAVAGPSPAVLTGVQLLLAQTGITPAPERTTR